MSLGRLPLTFCALGLIASAWTDSAPRKSPELTIHQAGAADLRLSHYRGKICVVALMSTTCPHCQTLTGILSEIQKEYGTRGVQILGAAFNDNAKGLMAGFAAKFHPAFPVGWITREEALNYLGMSIMTNSGYVPKVIFIDRAGMIREEHLQLQPENDYFGNPRESIRASLDRLLTTAGHRKSGADKRKG
jgi:hypothetical protein